MHRTAYERDYVGVAVIKTCGILETDHEQKADLLNAQLISAFVQEDQDGQVAGIDGAQYNSTKEPHNNKHGGGEIVIKPSYTQGLRAEPDPLHLPENHSHSNGPGIMSPL